MGFGIATSCGGLVSRKATKPAWRGRPSSVQPAKASCATQDQAGLLFAAAAYGLGFSGLIPSCVLAMRALFAASEATRRVLSGMAFSAWRAGAIHEAAAWRAGIAAGMVRIAPVVCRLLRQQREGSPA
jgi:hypothetical protein